MWDSGLIDEKLELALSQDEQWHELYSLQHDRIEKPGITSRPTPFHFSQLEPSNNRHQARFNQHRSRSLNVVVDLIFGTCRVAAAARSIIRAAKGAKPASLLNTSN